MFIDNKCIYLLLCPTYDWIDMIMQGQLISILQLKKAAFTETQAKCKLFTLVGNLSCWQHRQNATLFGSLSNCLHCCFAYLARAFRLFHCFWYYLIINFLICSYVMVFYENTTVHAMASCLDVYLLNHALDGKGIVFRCQGTNRRNTDFNWWQSRLCHIMCPNVLYQLLIRSYSIYLFIFGIILIFLYRQTHTHTNITDE